MGMEFRDSAYLLSPKNGRRLKTNMVFNLALGFSDLVDENDKKYVQVMCFAFCSSSSLRYVVHLVDTVKIDEDKAVLLTEGVKLTRDTLFFLTPSEDSRPAKDLKPASAKRAANGNISPTKNKTVGGKVLRNKTRSAAQDELLQSVAAKMAEHQRELHTRLQEEGKAKYSEEGGGSEGKEGKDWKKFQSYKGEGGLPKEVESLRVRVLHIYSKDVSYSLHCQSQIYVDRKAQTIVLPVHGFAVPFHINTIKNASKNDEGDFTYLRINFQTPGQLAGKKEDTVWLTHGSGTSVSQFYVSPSLSKIQMLLLSVPSRTVRQTPTGLMPFAGR
jgi:nucleosome binding factor SPN SPT16 subunit